MKTKPKKKLRGRALFMAALAAIEAHPKQYDQTVYFHFGTKHCFGGFCQMLAGFPKKPKLAGRQAAEALGIPLAHAWKIFSMERTIAQIRDFKPRRGWRPTI